jgi:hypothetical protein
VCSGMAQLGDAGKLGKNEFYKCPLSHVHPRHKQAFFKDFDAHFRIFGGRGDHVAVAQLHEEFAWAARHAESEKGVLSEEKVREISFKAWLQAVKQHTGKPIQVVKK